jgi:hypothetical protein
MSAKKRKFNQHSPFVIVNREVTQDASLRIHLIKRLEKLLGGKVVTFFTSFGRRNVLIVDDDAEMIESILAVEHVGGKKLFLVVNSPGGSGMAAERIVNTCRAYSNNQFEVVVPHMAKSAATMICFGASVIQMSKTAELGPVDPQVAYWPEGVERNEANLIWTSAEEYVRSYDKLMAAAMGAVTQRIEPFVQQLHRYDSRYIEQLRSAQQLAKDISVRTLASGMMSGIVNTEIEQKIKVFLSQAETSSHGRMINAKEAENCGLKIKMIDLQSELWHNIWELYVRSNWCVNNRCGKLIETSQAGVISA